MFVMGKRKVEKERKKDVKGTRVMLLGCFERSWCCLDVLLLFIVVVGGARLPNWVVPRGRNCRSGRAKRK